MAELAESSWLATWLLFTAAEREAVRPGATGACEVVARCAVAPLAALLRETAVALAWTVGWVVADGLTRSWETAAWLATPADWVVCRRRCVLLATWEAGAGVSGAWGPATERCTDWLVAAREAVAGASCDGLTGVRLGARDEAACLTTRDADGWAVAGCVDLAPGFAVGVTTAGAAVWASVVV